MIYAYRRSKPPRNVGAKGKLLLRGYMRKVRKWSRYQYCKRILLPFEPTDVDEWEVVLCGMSETKSIYLIAPALTEPLLSLREQALRANRRLSTKETSRMQQIFAFGLHLVYSTALLRYC